MSFLSIAFLMALPLAAAPIILHLIDRRRNVVIEWGAMQFLMEAASRKTNARKLEQWLLLLMRVLAVAALVLALSRPLLPGDWPGTATHEETIFVVDNSMSMRRTVGESSLFETAVDNAVEDLHDRDPGDYVRILLASPYPVWASSGSMRVDSASLQNVESNLRELHPTRGSSDILASLLTAVQAELQPTQQTRRIVLLTDGQRSDWNLDDKEGWQHFRSLLKSKSIPTDLQIMEMDRPAQSKANLAIDSVKSRRDLVGIDQTFSLTAHIQNYGPVSSSPASLNWTLDGRKMHQSRIPELKAGESHDALWKYSFSQTGIYSVSCEVESDDSLQDDNVGTIVVEVVDEVPVLLVESAPDLAEMQRDAFFVEAALGWIDRESLDDKSVYVPTKVEPARLAYTDLAQYRAIVIPNFTDLGAKCFPLLKQFVTEGGGLWIGLGPRSNADTFNQFLFAEGNGLAPLAVDRIVSPSSNRAPSKNPPHQTAIDPFSMDHPATAHLADDERLDLGEVTVDRRFAFVSPREKQDVSVLLRLNNGAILAAEKYVGQGRVIGQGIPLRMQWSQLARSQSCVVMVRDWMDYLTQPGAARYNLDPGEPLSVRVADKQAKNAILTTPRGEELELTGSSHSDGMLFRSSRTILPGDYVLDVSLTAEQIPFHVNRPPHESQLDSLQPDDRNLLAELAGLNQTSTAGADFATNDKNPVWPILLIVLIALIGGELLLSGIISRERFGSSAIAAKTEFHGELESTGMPPFGGTANAAPSKRTENVDGQSPSGDSEAETTIGTSST